MQIKKRETNLSLYFQCVMFLGISLLGVSLPALGIPIVTPHSHNNPVITDGDTTWLTNPSEMADDPDPDNPNTMQHQHRDRHPLDGKLLAGGDVTKTVDVGGGLGFGTYAVWDNRDWRFDRVKGESLDQYAHGFIEQGSNTAVRYRFLDNMDPRLGNRWFTTTTGTNMRNVINNAYSAWEAAVNGTQLNVNGVPVVRSVDFMPVASDERAEISIFLSDGGPAFEPSILRMLFQFRNDYDFDDTLPVGPPPFGNDADGNGIGDNRLDFNFIALHETGHSLGLGHFGRNPLINLMIETTVRIDFNVNGAGIDAGSQDGARDLYSIPIPEPSPLILCLTGRAVLAAMMKRKKRQ